MFFYRPFLKFLVKVFTQLHIGVFHGKACGEAGMLSYQAAATAPKDKNLASGNWQAHCDRFTALHSLYLLISTEFNPDAISEKPQSHVFQKEAPISLKKSNCSIMKIDNDIRKRDNI